MTSDRTLASLRVSFVIHNFDRGGSGRVVGHLARGFAARGMTVGIIAVSSGGPAEREVEAIAGPKVSIEYLGTSCGVRSLDLMVGLPRLVRKLREARPDIIIGAANNVAFALAAAVRLAGLENTRCYLKTTNPIASSRHRGLVRAIRRLAYSATFALADEVWTLSPDEADEMIAAFPRHRDRFRAVANPYVTPAMLAEPAVAPPPAAGRKRVAAVARLDRQKRLERLIAAFARVRHPNAELLILGEGDERASLERLVAELGLGERVAMPGHVADVAARLRQSDLLVMTSDYEGLPAAVLEAMAVDCPVLSTDCFPAARSLLGNAEGCGIITDHSPGPLALQIDACLARSRPTRLRHIAESFSIENGVASHIAAIVDDLSGNPKPKSGRDRSPPTGL